VARLTRSMSCRFSLRPRLIALPFCLLFTTRTSRRSRPGT
jgi:hypothetical protein